MDAYRPVPGGFDAKHRSQSCLLHFTKEAVNLNTWPATQFIGRDGRFKLIHSGIAAHASDEFNQELQQEFTSTFGRMLAGEETFQLASVAVTANAGAANPSAKYSNPGSDHRRFTAVLLTTGKTLPMLSLRETTRNFSTPPRPLPAKTTLAQSTVRAATRLTTPLMARTTTIFT